MKAKKVTTTLFIAILFIAIFLLSNFMNFPSETVNADDGKEKSAMSYRKANKFVKKAVPIMEETDSTDNVTVENDQKPDVKPSTEKTTQKASVEQPTANQQQPSKDSKSVDSNVTKSTSNSSNNTPAISTSKNESSKKQTNSTPKVNSTPEPSSSPKPSSDGSSNKSSGETGNGTNSVEMSDVKKTGEGVIEGSNGSRTYEEGTFTIPDDYWNN